jgi:hypothetical protein
MLAFDGASTIEPQDSLAITVGFEYRLSELLGLDFVLFNATSDVDGRLQGTVWIRGFLRATPSRGEKND